MLIVTNSLAHYFSHLITVKENVTQNDLLYREYHLTFIQAVAHEGKDTAKLKL